MTAGSLFRCVGDADRFLNEAWTQCPHLSERTGDDAYADLLSLDDVDRIVSTTSLRAPAFRLVQGGRPLPGSAYLRSGRIGGRTVHDLPDVGRIWACFDAGATLVLQGLHRYWAPLTRFCRDLEFTLSHRVQANAYLTPPGSQGLRVHHDTHDVFALQTYGRKRWVTYDPVLEAPLASQGWSSERLGAAGDPGVPTLDLELRPGDCLYVPRGTLHAAATVEEASLHITIGVNAATWHDVFGRLLDETAGEMRFREALPAGYASGSGDLEAAVAGRLKELASWIAELDPAQIAEAERTRFWSGAAAMLDGQLPQLLAVDRIDDDTVVQRRRAAVCRLGVEDGSLTVTLADRQLRMPAHVEPAVRHLAAGEPVRVGDLAGDLDAEGRRVLVRRLVREGLLLAHIE